MVQVEITADKFRRGGRWFALLALAVILAWGLVALAQALDLGENEREGPAGDVAAEIMPKRYQAVILANDRVFFGHLRALGEESFVLKDAYFIRTKPTTTDKQQQAQQQVAPIGEELQGPEPDLILMADQIVQVENLRSDSRVAAAIDSLQK